MRVIIEDGQGSVTCSVSQYDSMHNRKTAYSPLYNCDRRTKQKVKTLLMTMLIRMNNGEMDKQTKGILEELVLEQGRQREGTTLKENNTTEEL